MLAATRALQGALTGLITAMPGQRDIDGAIASLQRDASKVCEPVWCAVGLIVLAGAPSHMTPGHHGGAGQEQL
jgi:hypothetical protein